MKVSRLNKTIPVALLAAAFTLALPATVGAGESGAGDPMQFARGAKAWKNNCARCHNLRGAKELEDPEWEVSVLHMRKVANLPGETARDIAAFLKANN